MVMVWGDFKISEGQRWTRLMKLTHPSCWSPWRNRLHIKWSRLTTRCAGSERYWFVAPVNFCSINVTTMADFRLPMDMMGQWGQLCTGAPMIPWSQCKAGAHTSSRFHWQVGVIHNHALEKDLTNSGRKKCHLMPTLLSTGSLEKQSSGSPSPLLNAMDAGASQDSLNKLRKITASPAVLRQNERKILRRGRGRGEIRIVFWEETWKYISKTKAK